jgi:hypothetical protein
MFPLEPQELSCRTDPNGGGLAPEISPAASLGPTGSSLILLIHGYNNDLADARSVYTTFVDNLQKDWNKAPALLATIYRFYWPGDKSWGPFSFLSYALEIGPARDSAVMLATYMKELRAASGGPMNVYLIAHSLGNRLLMELLEIFANQGTPSNLKIQGICMMAGAVPVSKVDVGGDLYGAAELAQAYILYSTGDAVLHFAFPPGETAAGDAILPTAVGRFGQPAGQWAFTQQMTYGPKKTKYGHHDYWVQEETVTPVERLLDPAVPTDPPQASIADNMLPPTNELPTAVVPSRPLPTRPATG